MPTVINKLFFVSGVSCWRQNLSFWRSLQSTSCNRQLRSLWHLQRQSLAPHQPPLHDHRLRPGLHRTLRYNLHRGGHGPLDLWDEEHGVHVQCQDQDLVRSQCYSSAECRQKKLRLLLRRVVPVRCGRIHGWTWSSKGTFKNDVTHYSKYLVMVIQSWDSPSLKVYYTVGIWIQDYLSLLFKLS